MSEDTIGPDLESRLRRELDRVQPRFTTPRYLLATPRTLTWRLAPAALGASVLAILALSAFFATGSPNPVVWGERAVTVLEPPTASPTPSVEDHHKAPPGPRPPRSPQRESPTPKQSPESHESPQPSDDHTGHDSSGSGSGSGSDSGSGSGDSHIDSQPDSD